MNSNMLAIAATSSDEALLARLEATAGRTRQDTAQLVADLSELQIRKADRGEGPGSLFEYCVRVLRLSEAASFNRLAAASAARKFPMILDLLADGSVNLTTVRVLAPHLTAENHRSALEEAIGRTKAEVLEIRARLSPQPDVPASVRKLPVPNPASAPQRVAPLEAGSPSTGGSSTPAPNPPMPAIGRPGPSAQRPAVEPLSPERYRVQFTIGKETQERLRRVQALLRREIPNGDPGAIFDRALTLLLREAEKKKFSATDRPRPPRATRRGSRDIPAHVERAVWKRDRGQCAFVGRKGRCAQRSFLEFHHVDPHGHGGEVTVDNISLRCRAHNAYESELIFGRFDPSAVRESEAAYEADRQGSWKTCPGTGLDGDERTMARFVGMEA